MDPWAQRSAAQRSAVQCLHLHQVNTISVFFAVLASQALDFKVIGCQQQSSDHWKLCFYWQCATVLVWTLTILYLVRSRYKFVFLSVS